MTRQSALGLTAREHFLLARLMDSSSRQRSGDDPWERAWTQAYNPADGRAFAKLARLGIIECKPRRGKLPSYYRWRKEP